jgi:mannose-6-phosphate isomerase-like protein (cupin superfamily)
MRRLCRRQGNRVGVVLPVGARYESERGTTLEVVSREGDQLSIERDYAPRTGHADPHYHLDLTQTWECLKGEGLVEVDGKERRFATGDRVELSPETPHRDPWLPGEGTLRIRGYFDPTNPFIEAYTAAFAHHLTAGTTNSQDDMPLLQIFAMVKETDGQSFRAGIPRVIQKASLPVVRLIARLRGYRASYD